MKKLVIAITLALASIPVAAQAPDSAGEQRNGRPPGQPDYFSLGAAIGAGTPEFVDGGFQVNPFPFVGFKWGRLYSNQAGLGYELYSEGRLRLSAVATFAVQDLNRNNVDALDDLESLNLPLFVGASIDLPIDTVLLTGSIQKEIGIASGGWRATGALSRTYPVSRQLLLTPSISVEWNDRTGTNYLYGVSAAEASSFRSLYRAGDSFKASGSLTGIYRLSPKFTLVGSTGLTWHSDEIFDSPLVDKRLIFSTFFALAYNF